MSTLLCTRIWPGGFASLGGESQVHTGRQLHSPWSQSGACCSALGSKEQISAAVFLAYLAPQVAEQRGADPVQGRSAGDISDLL